MKLLNIIKDEKLDTTPLVVEPKPDGIGRRLIFHLKDGKICIHNP
jgi:hypothetical protein